MIKSQINRIIFSFQIFHQYLNPHFLAEININFSLTLEEEDFLNLQHKEIYDPDYNSH